MINRTKFILFFYLPKTTGASGGFEAGVGLWRESICSRNHADGPSRDLSSWTTIIPWSRQAGAAPSRDVHFVNCALTHRHREQAFNVAPCLAEFAHQQS